jgi:superfamily II DNA or RNA helicase
MSGATADELDEERLQKASEMMCQVSKVSTLRNFQVEAGKNMLRGEITILDVPTGAGKTLSFWFTLFYHFWRVGSKE